MNRFCLVLSIFLALVCGSTESLAKPPRLILQVTVDQLRGDLIYRHLDQFGEGGFRYLVKNGTVWEEKMA